MLLDIRGPVLEEAMRMRANGEKILRVWIQEIQQNLALQRQTSIHVYWLNARDIVKDSDSKGGFSATVRPS